MELPKLIEWSPRLTELARRFTADRNSLTGPERRELGTLWRAELTANGLISPWDLAHKRARPVDSFQAASIIASATRPPDPFLYPIPDWDWIGKELVDLGGPDARAAIFEWRAAESKIEEHRKNWAEFCESEQLPTAEEWWESVKARFSLAEKQLWQMIHDPLPPAGEEGMPYPLTEAQREAFFGDEEK